MMHSDDDRGPATIPLQPRPINHQVVHSERGGAIETAIARAWRLEDARICRLCAECTATVADGRDTALCLKVVGAFVPDAEAALFRDLSGDVGGGADDQRAGSAAG